MTMKKTLLLIIAFAACISSSYNAQNERYIDQIFTDVEDVETIIYGANATILAFPVFGEAILQPLVADMYIPEGDAETSRPLIIYAHTGNFLPHPENGSPSGTRTDSTVVEICTRLAKMGYVVASIDYRLGWNPLAEEQDERIAGLINAAYRGVQDARTAIRFFRMTVAEFNNPYGIDPDKIVLWGQGTGGYISLACAALDDYSEVLLPKFFTDDGMGNQIPMVIESINGDIYGTSFGIVPEGIGAPNPNDTLCYPNHVGYSSDFNLAVHTGGAMGDASWLDAETPPIISFQTPTDPFAPYNSGILIVPTTNEPVVEVQGADSIATLQTQLGNNAAWYDHEFIDPFSVRADMLNEGREGLFPVLRPAGSELDSSPWDFWSPDNANNANGLITNPDMSPEKARTFIDSIIGYYAPRACITLGLGCDLQGSGITVGLEELDAQDVNLNISPNPAEDFMRFTVSSDLPMTDIYIYDLEGRLVKAHVSINNSQFEMPRHMLQAGIYLAEVRFGDARVTQKIVFK